MTSITIPLRLVSEANSREHWTKKAKRHKQQRMLVKAYLSSHTPPALPPITITLTRAAPRLFDDDNNQMAFKAIRDFIGEWITGITTPGRGDSIGGITWKYNQIKTKDKEYFIVIDLANF